MSVRRIFAAACLVLACVSSLPAQINLRVMAERAGVRHSGVPRRVLAFYYPWYQNPKVEGGSGLGMTWEGVDEGKKQIGNVAHFPKLGPYDSHSPQTIAQHCRWAKQSGVDGWIVSWWGKGTPTDRVMPRVLDAAQKAGLSVTIYYETVPKPQNGESAAKDLLYVLQQYGRHPAWLTVDKRPVVFVYGRALGEIGLPGWLDAIARVNCQYPGGAVFLGDDMGRASARIFDGIHTYNPVGSVAGKTADDVRKWARETYATWVGNADAQGRISTLTVFPGYDDTKIRKPGLAADRLGGKLYQVQWEEVLAADPHWVLITSWNEWYEGSEIEPSAEFGDQYLKQTAEFAARFKAKGPRADKAPKSPAAGRKENPELAKASFPSGVLPDAASPAIWSLVRLPVQPQSLSWENVAGLQAADAKRLPVLFYAGDESYHQTVRTPGDVDEGLLRYLRGGGLLVVLPSGPMPFHYNERGQGVATSDKLGLPLSVAGADGGWERPPEGAKFQFVQVGKHLPHVPARFPFTAGDPRWRPFVRSRLAEGDVFVPLVELRDVEGKSYGYAVAYVEHKASQPKGAKLLYAWFGLLDSPQGEALVEDLLVFAGEKVK